VHEKLEDLVQVTVSLISALEDSGISHTPWAAPLPWPPGPSPTVTFYIALLYQ